ncbi:hypothetical protein CAOG_009492 [Capsaspora owczarzaki ATCC 30864]|uniref:Uncharacterized protein n=1 Tax=Capsaspora owczarzaki (strain ATCC 30864) TaxID=595528 RepID=A0A0D2WLM5_CAPO3|nr:hypothetical protein CAOG_009492 [Capsaspora owczarzaki ATCC 30864]
MTHARHTAGIVCRGKRSEQRLDISSSQTRLLVGQGGGVPRKQRCERGEARLAAVQAVQQGLARLLGPFVRRVGRRRAAKVKGDQNVERSLRQPDALQAGDHQCEHGGRLQGGLQLLKHRVEDIRGGRRARIVPSNQTADVRQPAIGLAAIKVGRRGKVQRGRLELRGRAHAEGGGRGALAVILHHQNGFRERPGAHPPRVKGRGSIVSWLLLGNSRDAGFFGSILVECRTGAGSWEVLGNKLGETLGKDGAY